MLLFVLLNNKKFPVPAGADLHQRDEELLDPFMKIPSQEIREERF